jgi:hypothetical protein
MWQPCSAGAGGAALAAPEIFFEGVNSFTGLRTQAFLLSTRFDGQPMGTDMTHSEYRAYLQMTNDRNAFDGWMKASAVVGSIFAAAVAIMAISTYRSPAPERVVAGNMLGTEISASARHHAPTGGLSPYEMTIKTVSYQLPVHDVVDPF